MAKNLSFMLIILSLFIGTKSYADSELEIGGLLLDNSRSRFGHDFAYKFSQLWRDIPNTQGINVQINELIVPRAGTKLNVLLNDRLIYVTYFGRRQSPIKEKVDQAIFILIDAMAQSKYTQGHQNNPDMLGDGW